jgi:hypothetical protein
MCCGRIGRCALRTYWRGFRKPTGGYFQILFKTCEAIPEQAVGEGNFTGESLAECLAGDQRIGLQAKHLCKAEVEVLNSGPHTHLLKVSAQETDADRRPDHTERHIDKQHIHAGGLPFLRNSTSMGWVWTLQAPQWSASSTAKPLRAP